VKQFCGAISAATEHPADDKRESMRKATIRAAIVLGWAMAAGLNGSVALSGGQPPDETVAARVRLALATANISEARQIEVRAFNGEADLSGAVDSDDRKSEIGRVVSAVSGVTAVHNALTVRDRSAVREDSVDDSAIARKVVDALGEDAEVKSQSLRVACTNGIVQLDGVVASAASRDRAELLARTVNGVTQVVNRLQID
jgi:osmotically-inducible protein OsmY